MLILKIIQFRDHKNIISGKLARIREKQKISQQELAVKMQTMGINIDQQAISKIELDKRIVTDYELVCLCKILNVKTDDLTLNIEWWNQNYILSAYVSLT